jgi:hypothetical protein
MTAAASGLERDGNRVRLITRGGYNWADRNPRIVEAARKIRQKHFRARWRGGGARVSYFNALHVGTPRALLLSLGGVGSFLWLLR